MHARLSVALLIALRIGPAVAAPPVVIRGDTVHTMAGPAIADGIVVIEAGKVARVGPAAEVPIPPGARVVRGAVVTPGLVDAHTVVGLTGWLNQAQDQDQLDEGDPVQPELRAIDSYNPASGSWNGSAASASPRSTPATPRARSSPARPWS